MKELKRNIAIMLALCMVITGIVPAYAGEVTLPEQSLVREETENAEILHTQEAISDTVVSETNKDMNSDEASSDDISYEDETILEGIKNATPANADYDETEETQDDTGIDAFEEATPANARYTDELFIRELVVDGITITLTADPGVFPEDAELWAEKVEDEATEEAIEEAVEKERENDVNVAASYKFDIKMFVNGEEVQPDTTRGSVKVTFTLAEELSECLDANAYHLKEDADGELTAENLGAEVKTVEETAEETVTEAGNVSETVKAVSIDEDGVPEDGTIEDDVTKKVTKLEADTDGFSYYVVEFTYDELHYVLPHGASIKLSTILGTLDIEGTVSEATASNPELLTVTKDVPGDDWTVTTAGTSEADGTLNVTAGDTPYVITIKNLILYDSIGKPTFYLYKCANGKATMIESLNVFDGIKNAGSDDEDLKQYMSRIQNGGYLCTFPFAENREISVLFTNGTGWSFKWDISDMNPIRLYAGFDFDNIGNTNIVILDANGGTVSPEYIDTTGGVLDIPVPKREGFVFLGWYDANTNNQMWFNEGGKKAYAKWGHSITVSASEGGTATASSAAYEQGATVRLTATPDPGYRFKQWESSDVNVKPDGTFSMPNKPVSVTAVFEALPVNRITFIANGHGEAPDPIVAVPGMSISAPNEPFSAGYIFGGWYTEAKCLNLYVFSTMPPKDLILYAKWTPIKYTITWEDWDGKVIATSQVDKGVLPKYPGASKPTRSGYIFTGWTPEIDLAASNMTYTATYEKKSSGGGGGGGSGSGGGGGSAVIAYAEKPAVTPITVAADGAQMMGTAVVSIPAAQLAKSGLAPVQGIWSKTNGMWAFTKTDGNKAKNEWALITVAGGNASYFYFDSNGNMVTGWQQVGGKWMYFNNESGSLLGASLRGPGRTPDGYEIDASGAWTGR